MAVTQVIKTLGNVLTGLKTIVDDWLGDNISNPSNPPLDRTLSLSNACAPADLVGDLKTKINTIDDKAPVIVESVSGDIVSFDDGAEDMPLKKCLIQIEPVQDLHGQDSPYPAGGGKNILDADGYSVTTEAGTDRTIVINKFAYLEAGFAYTFSCRQIGDAGSAVRNLLGIANDTSQSALVWESTNNPNAHVHTVTYSPSVSGYYRPIYWAHTLGTAVTLDEFQCEKGTAFSSYAPYSNICPISGWTGGDVTVSPTDNPNDPDKTVYPITWQTEAGTVYSGSLDLTTGVLTVDHGVKTLNGSETWGWSPNNSLATTAINGGIITNGTTQYNKYTLNSTFSDKSWAGRSSVDGSIGMFYGASALFCKYSKITSGQEAQAFFTSNPTTVIYELATPITYQLTPTEIKTLFQNNSIWSDIGPVSVDYCADTKTYIDNKIAEIVNG